MSVTSYTQWRFPILQTFDGHGVGLRINRISHGATWPTPTYGGQTDPVTVFILDDVFSSTIGHIGSLEITKHDPDGDLCFPKKDFQITDVGEISGVDGDGNPFTYDLYNNQSSLTAEIFQDPGAVYEVYLTDYSGSVVSPTIEVYFKGEIEYNGIQWMHDNIAQEFTALARRLMHAHFTANSAIIDLRQKPGADGLLLPRTGQDLVSYIVANSVYDDIQNVYVGSSFWLMDDYRFFPNANSGPYALAYAWHDNTTPFPRAVCEISISTLANAIALTCGMQGATIDTNMMFDFYSQKFQNPGGTNPHWPLTNLNIASWDDVYVQLNFWMGMPITANPLDDSSGSYPSYEELYVQWPCSFPRDSTLDKLVGWICLRTGCYADYEIDTSGNFTLVFRARRTRPNSIPSNWILLNGSSEEPTQVGKSSLIVQMQGDDLQALAGPNAKDVVSLTIPGRCHKWGSPVGTPNPVGRISPSGFLYAGPVGIFIDPTIGVGPTGLEVQWNNTDSLDLLHQPLCVTVEKKPNADYFGGSEEPTDNGWIGASMLLYKTFTGSLPGNVYDGSIIQNQNIPSTSNVRYNAIAAILPKGLSLPNDEYCTSPAGTGSYFIANVALAQFYYQEVVGNKIVFKQRFNGCRDDSGSLQGVKPNMEMSTYLRGKVRKFISHAVLPGEMESITEVTWVEIPTDGSGNEIWNDQLPPVTFISEAGSQSSSSSSSSSNGSSSSSSSIGWPPPFITMTGTGAVQIPRMNVQIVFNDPLTTGATVPVTVSAGQIIMLKNETGNNWTQSSGSDFYLANGDSWTVQFTGSSSQSDPTLPVGWNLIAKVEGDPV